MPAPAADAVNQALQQARFRRWTTSPDKSAPLFDQLDKDATGAAKTLRDLSSRVINSANVYAFSNYIALTGEDAFGSRRIAGR